MSATNTTAGRQIQDAADAIARAVYGRIKHDPAVWADRVARVGAAAAETYAVSTARGRAYEVTLTSTGSAAVADQAAESAAAVLVQARDMTTVPADVQKAANAAAQTAYDATRMDIPNWAVHMADTLAPERAQEIAVTSGLAAAWQAALALNRSLHVAAEATAAALTTIATWEDRATVTVPSGLVAYLSDMEVLRGQSLDFRELNSGSWRIAGTRDDLDTVGQYVRHLADKRADRTLSRDALKYTARQLRAFADRFPNLGLDEDEAAV